LLAHVFEEKIELVADLIAHDPARADAAGLSQGFEASRDVNAVPEDIAVIYDYIAEIDPHAELDPLLC